jgi:hypothetical protein
MSRLLRMTDPTFVPGPGLSRWLECYQTSLRLAITERPMKIRRIVSLTVFTSFIVLACSGLMLFVSPRGRVAQWGNWTLLGLTKDQLIDIHTTVMVLFLTVGIWHIVLNWRSIVGYLKNRPRKRNFFTPEFILSLALCLLFLVGPLAGLPPFRQFLEAREEIKAFWDRTRGTPPRGHAEDPAGTIAPPNRRGPGP